VLWTRTKIAITPTGHPPNIYFWPIAVSTDIRFATLPPIHWAGASMWTSAERVSGALKETRAELVSPDREEKQPWRSIHLALGDVELEMPLRWDYYTPIADLPAAEFRAHASTPGQLTSRITMAAYRSEVIAAAPLKAGVGFNCPGRAGRITSITNLSRGVQIQLRETILEGWPPVAQLEFGIRQYILRNKARRQAVLLKWRENKRVMGTIGIAATGVVSTRGVLELETPSSPAALLDVDAAWLNGAELVIVEPKSLGVLTRQLTIDNFILGGPPVGSVAGQPGGGSSASPLTHAGKTSLAGTGRRPDVWGALSPSRSWPSRPVSRSPGLKTRPTNLALVRGDVSETAVQLARVFPRVLPESPIPLATPKPVSPRAGEGGNPQSLAGAAR
jgi:hypothetical protein